MSSHLSPAAPTLKHMRRGPFVPGRNTDPAVVALKHAHIRDPHVAPINALADRVADAEGIARGLVPYVDPQLGGVDATVLALLDNPSTKAEAGTGSGLLSLENDDPTARKSATHYNEYGLTPGEVVHWNVAPAPVAGARNGSSTDAERARGARWLPELLELLPNLRVVLLMGANARDGWRRSWLTPAGIVIPTQVPHPSDRGMANTDAHLRLHCGLVAMMTELHGPGQRFPPEPLPSGKRKAPSSTPRARAASKPAALVPATPSTCSTESDLPDGQSWGWWPSFEHYSSPGSNPWGTSRSLARVEAAIDRHNGPPRKKSPIARLTASGWMLEHKRGNGHTVEMGADQSPKYLRARQGGPRGNLGKVPPAVELTRPTVDLDQ